MVDQMLSKSQENRGSGDEEEKSFEIELSKFSLDGLVTVSFEVDLYVPKVVQNILA